MPAQPLPAPLAVSACQVDLADNSTGQQVRIIRVDNLPHKLVARCPTKSVVSAPEFEIRIANPADQQSDEREPLCAAGTSCMAQLDTPIFKING
jgi:hypothetical protein